MVISLPFPVVLDEVDAPTGSARASTSKDDPA